MTRERQALSGGARISISPGSDDGVPDDIRRFIRTNIDSVETLRVLLLLRARRERDWTIESIASELRSSPAAIRRRLEHAEQRLLAVRRGDAFRYGSSAGDEAALAALARLYRERRTTVIDLIFSRPD